MERRKRIVGTAGHIDHGKTTLVEAVTGRAGDRLPEEKRRGITIDLGFAPWFTDEFQIGFIDVPGHERFVKNMLAGVGGIDAVLLVVAADESIKPQTREHFAICRLLGVGTGLVAITKSDLVDPEMVELVRLEIEDLVRGSFLAGQPIVAVSAATGAGVPELCRSIIDVVRHAEEREVADRLFRMPVDRAFVMKGFGAVVTGTALAGELRVDTELEILPGGLRSRARQLQVHGTQRDVVRAGERTSVNLPDVSHEQVHRGQQMVPPGMFRPSSIVTARLSLLPDAAPLEDQTRVRFHLYSAELLGSVRILDGERRRIDPGTEAPVQIHLESPIVALEGDHFVIRRYSPAITIGGGTILDSAAPKLNRRTRIELIEQLASPDFAIRTAVRARLARLRGLSVRDLQARTGWTGDLVRSALAAGHPDLIAFGSGESLRWVHREAVTEFRKKAIAFLETYFAARPIATAVPKSEFVQSVVPADVDASQTAALLADLEREKILTVAGDMIEVPGRSKELRGAEGELARTIEERFRAAGLQPPPVSELIRAIPQKPKTIEGIVSYLVKRGTLIRLSEGIYLHHQPLAEAAQKLSAERGKTIDVGWFKEFFGLSRKIAIPLLEHFDRERVTKRTGDQRLVL